jgi:hypothetical protein
LNPVLFSPRLRLFKEANFMSVTPGEIAQRAFEIWDHEGRPEGRELEHWLRAETELNQRGDGKTTPSSTPRGFSSKESQPLKKNRPPADLRAA